MDVRTAADAGTTFDPERLRYVTENFTSLQGLTFVAMGTMFFLTSMEDVYGSPWWLSLILWAALIAVIRWIPKYYQRQFGRVESRSPTDKQAAIFVLVIVVLLFWGRHFESWGRYVLGELTHRLHFLISDPTEQISLSPFFLWTFAFFTSLRKRLESIDPFRPYFFGLGMIGCVAVAVYPLWHPVIREHLLWRTLNAGAFGLSFMA